ncbi:Retrovirus-related Pol polyprotein from transposon TNT 1-94 [Gossypium australe]|uniref:Retrovirus-related Pol polyprotein from transposon TNT 1-94 n=1 Tax=Gossypium australe TaxID=47621 RepID=A0A5B6VIY1_9ROSI|nr:Retrovirus-related Pol polyprotein from transposon TNT 1-94 [Gossypium australe]
MSCFIFYPTGSKLMTIKMKSKSFPIEWKQSYLNAYASVVDDSILWHKRLGLDVCAACQFGKQAKLSFPHKNCSRDIEKLQLVHTDVCGHMSTPSLNGSRFKRMVEVESSCLMKKLRSNNGTEYNSMEFARFCQQVGTQ